VSEPVKVEGIESQVHGPEQMQMFRSAWLCYMTLVLVSCCSRHGHISWSFRCSM